MTDLTIIGDVHLGKKFIENVPLHRRGEREANVLLDFQSRLMEATEGLCVQVGDLFDTFQVSNEVLYAAYSAIAQAAKANKDTLYVFMAGNHDASRDEEAISSFEVLVALCGFPKNVRFFMEPEIFCGYGFMPWHPFKPASELADHFKGSKLSAVFTHCDMKSYGGSEFNVLPYEKLSQVTRKVYNGHIHTPEVKKFGDLEVVVTGSMQPYSHAEDPEGQKYLTLTYTEFKHLPPALYQDKYVRVILEEGEEIEEIPNCMGFTTKRAAAVALDEGQDLTVSLGEFNARDILMSCLEDAKVPEEISAKVLEKFDASQS